MGPQPSRGLYPSLLCVDLVTLKAVLGPRPPKAGVVQLKSWILLPRPPPPAFTFKGLFAPVWGRGSAVAIQLLGTRGLGLASLGSLGLDPSECRIRAGRGERRQTLHFLIRKTGIIPILQKMSAKPLTNIQGLVDRS